MITIKTIKKEICEETNLGSLPDIDTDFCGRERPRVKEYMEQRFGASQVVSLGTYTTMQLKAAITDLARCEGVPIQIVRRITAKLRDEEGMKSVEDFFVSICKDTELREFVKSHTELINDMMICLNAPKAASIHACGTVIFPDEKTSAQWVPIKEQKGLSVTEWEGSEIEETGFLKEDILGIAQLDKLSDMLKLIEQNHGIKLDLYKDIPLDDPMVFEYIKKGFLNDVFHFGAKGLSSYCVQMQPESLDEMGICAALYRPGPIENNIHNEYILTKRGEMEKDAPIGGEKVLSKSKNFLVYQEDIMRLCQELADFDLEATDSVRKCIGKKLTSKIKTFGDKFVEGYVKKFGDKGVTEEYARDLWKQMEEFGKYSFNKCLHGDEKIYPNELTIKELYEKGVEDIPAITMDKYGSFIPTKVKEIRYAGKRFIYKIQTSDGATVKCSGNHKFPTPEGHKYAFLLRKGDVLYTYKHEMRINVEIIFIDVVDVEPTYDVEIDHPEHNFVTGEGIVTCNSHAIAYSRNGYNCIWLKIHYPIEFWSVTFSYAELKDYPYYINEIQESGEIEIRPVDINKSGINIVSDIKTNSMYWALNSVKQCGEKAQQFIAEEREKNGEFFSLDEFIDRCIVKNSPVNKSVIENLIYSGAFDKLEKIEHPAERLRLIESYRENKRVKVLEDKDLLTNIIKARKEKEDWWWTLQQKKLSGFATFDYEGLINRYHEQFYEAVYYDVRQVKYLEGDNHDICAIIGGYVLDIVERKSKKGKFCIITLESNYEFINVIVFSELYSEYEEFLQSSKGNLLLVDGYIQWDKWKEEYCLMTNLNTSFTVLS
nr:MAG TPA: DNA polymerase III, alpha subunit [Caudoviricetes sp.]